MNGDVPGAAHRLGLTMTAHDVVLGRVAEKTAALDKAIAEAIDAGVLKQFNTQYRQRRLEAKKNGQPFMSYSEAMRRLELAHRKFGQTGKFGSEHRQPALRLGFGRLVLQNIQRC